MSAYSLRLLFISSPSLLCFNIIYVTVSRYILRSVVSCPRSSLILFHSSTHRTAHDPPCCQGQSSASTEQGVVNQPPLYPFTLCCPGEESARLYGFPPFTPKSIDRISLLSLRADKRERPEPSWPLDVSTYIHVIYNM